MSDTAVDAVSCDQKREMTEDKASSQAPLINCIIPIHFRGPLTYRWPFGTELPPVGTRLLLPLGPRRIVGIFSGRAGEFSDRKRLKDVLAVMEKEPLITEGLLNFIRWAASYYYYPLGPALSEALPSGFLSPTKKGTEEVVSKGIGPGRSRFDIHKWHQGKIRELSPEQSCALDEISGFLETGKFNPALLFGITGSGKTEVYLRAVEKCLSLGKSTLILVPEISMTGQLAGWFSARFSEGLSLLHSGLTRQQRRDQWWKIRSGESKIVVGARSAIFAPLSSIGLIIVDEEHDSSYKQADKFKYNARDLALVRGKMENAAVILGSGTPSVSSYFNALQGKYRLLEMKNRVGGGSLPSVELVDRRGKGNGEKGRNKKAEKSSMDMEWLSEPLKNAISETLEKGRQVLLFLNRRGFATYIFCPECGYVFKCSSCDVILAWHRKNKALLKAADREPFREPGLLCCHYCGQAYPALPSCEKCGGQAVRASGFGTEKVAQEFLEHFPGTTVARIDRDTVTRRKKMEKILRAFRKGEIDCLVGTQMITKGHDFPGLALVGVLWPDLALNVPEYCAAERTFQIISQVAGRAGRSNIHGRVIIQTFMPEHYSIVCATEHDYQQFYDKEIRTRHNLGYPPLGRIVNIRFSGVKKGEVEQAAQKTASFARSRAGSMTGITVLGPVESPKARIKSRYRYQLLLKGDIKSVRMLCGKIDSRLSSLVPNNVRLEMDVDPLNFM